jgi:hypothetical protein
VNVPLAGTGVARTSAKLVTTSVSSTTAVKAAATATNPVDSLAFTPSSVNFGSVAEGTTNTQTVQLKNDGSSSVNITGHWTSGTGYKTAPLPISFTLAPGQSTAVTVYFAPTTLGTASGTWTVEVSGTSSRLLLPLTGTAISTTRVLTATPGSVNFGNVEVGGFTTSSITLKNTGNSSVTVQGMSTSGTGFSATGVASGLTIAANQTAVVAAEFAPKTAGSATGSVTIKSNGTSSGSTVISMAGTGTTASSTSHSVQLNWAASSSSSVVGYNVYRSTVSGGSFAKIVTSQVSGTSYTDKSVQASTEYYYVVTAVAADGTESSHSNQTSALVP